jgi:ABC-type nickel/cobalt efflux system permease component RcnA
MHFRKQNTYMHRHSISQKHHTISHFSCDTCHIPTRCHREKIFKLKTTWIFALYTALRVSWGVLEVMPLGSSSGRHWWNSLLQGHFPTLTAINLLTICYA